jgi:hypothetical protein
MKKNAILVAGILFLAGCATHQGGSASYESGSRMNGATTPTSQYASSGGYARTDDVHADSSIRGGSAEARGYKMSSNPQEPSSSSDRNFQADSTIRDGSMGSTSWSNSRINSEASADMRARTSMPDSDLAQGGFDAVAVGQGTSANQPDTGMPVEGTGETSPGPELNSSQHLNANISGNNAIASGEPQPQYSHQKLTPAHAEERNSGRKENDDAALLSGSANIQNESTSNQGAPAATEQGSSTSHSSSSSSATVDSSGSASLSTAPESDLPVNGNQPNELFKNNRAQGVGSAATGEAGAYSSANNPANDQLAQKVKQVLTKESTGTHGMLRAEISKDIKVTSSGDGVVTLKGTVPSQQDKEIVGIRAAEVAGVKRVENQLNVAPKTDPANRDLSTGHNLDEQPNNLNPQP